MSENDTPHESVKRFVDRHVRTEKGSSTTLSEFWDYYGPRPRGVRRERFKSHLVQALPESVDRDLNTFYGVEVVPFDE